MSQVFSIRRVKHSGAPAYLGTTDGEDTWSANPERIIRWMCDGYRFRFNQHRGLRQKTVWTNDPDKPGHRIPLRDSQGQKVLTPLGDDPIEISDKEARQRFPHLAALPAYILQHPSRVENTEWWSAIKRRRTLRDKRVPAGTMPRFRSAKAGDCRFGIWYNGGSNAILTRTGKKSGVLTIKGQNPAGHRQESISTLAGHDHRATVRRCRQLHLCRGRLDAKESHDDLSSAAANGCTHRCRRRCRPGCRSRGRDQRRSHVRHAAQETA